jgi:protein TonB
MPKRRPEQPPAPKEVSRSVEPKPVAVKQETAKTVPPAAKAESVPPVVKPVTVQQAAKQDSAPQAANQNPVLQAATQPAPTAGTWQAMALAPADKAKLKVPTARPSGGAYSSKVWAALARHKPRAGMRGSATVVFSIGENGSLRGVKIGRSSGNARIDQLALQTVRGAGPYPPPPSGVASYTIRIDFQ